MITLYTGELLISPIPLEMTLHRCNYGCAYCFATLNFRHSGYTRANVTGIQNLLATYHARDTLVAKLLRQGYPILLSNRTDPFASANSKLILPLLETLTAQGIHVAFQTRGGTLVNDALDIVAPSCWYISITSDQPDRTRQIEPAAPPLTEKLKMIDALIARGHCVTVGINPYVPEWWADAPAFLRELKARGVHGIWTELLHLHYRQRNLMTDRERAALTEETIALAMKRQPPKEWIDGIARLRDDAQAAGLEIFSGGQGNRSDFFTPYKTYYRKTFPVMQEFLNHCLDAQRDPHDLIDFEEFWQWAAPYLPTGKHVGMSKYIGTVAHNFFWKTKVPDAMSYKQVMNIFWEHPEIGRHLALSDGFAMPARWDDTEPAGWIVYVTQAWRRVVSCVPEAACYVPLDKARLRVR